MRDYGCPSLVHVPPEKWTYLRRSYYMRDHVEKEISEDVLSQFREQELDDNLDAYMNARRWAGCTWFNVDLAPFSSEVSLKDVCGPSMPGEAEQ